MMNLPESDYCKLLGEISAEHANALAKFPANNGNLNFAALVEEVGELAQAMLHTRFGGKCAGWKNVRAEAVQVAVMAIRIALEGDETLCLPGE